MHVLMVGTPFHMHVQVTSMADMACRSIPCQIKPRASAIQALRLSAGLSTHAAAPKPQTCLCLWLLACACVGVCGLVCVEVGMECEPPVEAHTLSHPVPVQVTTAAEVDAMQLSFGTFGLGDFGSANFGAGGAAPGPPAPQSAAQPSQAPAPAATAPSDPYASLAGTIGSHAHTQAAPGSHGAPSGHVGASTFANFAAQGNGGFGGAFGGNLGSAPAHGGYDAVQVCLRMRVCVHACVPLVQREESDGDFFNAHVHSCEHLTEASGPLCHACTVRNPASLPAIASSVARMGFFKSLL